jgi:hypothetical protein
MPSKAFTYASFGQRFGAWLDAIINNIKTRCQKRAIRLFLQDWELEAVKLLDRLWLLAMCKASAGGGA